MPARQYTPPALNERIRLRNPADQPNREADALGNYTDAEPGWGDEVWAGRRDRRPQTSYEESVVVQELITVWTIRERDGIAVDAEIVYGGKVFQAIGPPVERGGVEHGRAERYMEIHTRLRQ